MRYETMKRLERLLNKVVEQECFCDLRIIKCADAGEDYYPTRNENNWVGCKCDNHYGIYRLYNKEVDYSVQLTDWRGQNDYYIMVFDNFQKNNASLEIKNVNGRQFVWRYKPCKRDGKNASRKYIFAKKYPDGIVDFSIPEDLDGTIKLCNLLIEVAELRKRADELKED